MLFYQKIYLTNNALLIVSVKIVALITIKLRHITYNNRWIMKNSLKIIMLTLCSFIFMCASSQQKDEEAVSDKSVKELSPVELTRAIESAALQIEETANVTGKNGKLRLTYDDASLLAVGSAAAGKKTGTWTYYRRNTAGTKKLSEGAYKDGQKTGLWSYYDEKGKLIAKNNYLWNKLNGSAIVYHPNGVFQTETDYKNGLKNGRYREYYENGNPKEISFYIDGKKNGQVNLYYFSGKRLAIGQCKNDMKNGKWVFYRESGTVESEGIYTNDIKTGVWTYTDEKGIKRTEQAS